MLTETQIFLLLTAYPIEIYKIRAATPVLHECEMDVNSTHLWDIIDDINQKLHQIKLT